MMVLSHPPWYGYSHVIVGGSLHMYPPAIYRKNSACTSEARAPANASRPPAISVKSFSSHSQAAISSAPYTAAKLVGPCLPGRVPSQPRRRRASASPASPASSQDSTAGETSALCQTMTTCSQNLTTEHIWRGPSRPNASLATSGSKPARHGLIRFRSSAQPPLRTSHHSARDDMARAVVLDQSSSCTFHMGEDCASRTSPPDHDRRSALTMALAATAGWQSGRACAQAAEVAAASSIQEAIDQATAGDTVIIRGGVYREKLLITKPLVLRAASKDDRVEVVWNTEDHYEPVLSVQAAEDVVVEGLTLRHSSPSIANNYAVFFQGGSVSLKSCDVQSSTGSGVAAEGGLHSLIGCLVSGCERHGVAVFGTLDGDDCQVKVSACTVSKNKLNGLFVRDSGSVILEDTTSTGNGDYGLWVTYASAEVAQGCSLSGNRKGDVFEGDGSDIGFLAL